MSISITCVNSMDASYIPIAKARGFTTHWITSQAYKTGGETIEKKYVFYKPGNIYALYYRKENTLYYNKNFTCGTKIIYLI